MEYKTNVRFQEEDKVFYLDLLPDTTLTPVRIIKVKRIEPYTNTYGADITNIYYEVSSYGRGKVFEAEEKELLTLEDTQESLDKWKWNNQIKHVF